MIRADLPADEKQRLQALFDYDILDTEAEKVFDDLTRLASEICDTPIALISLIDPERQWFKSARGIDASETSRDIAFCAHAIHQRHIFEIPDATQDIRFHDNPLVTGEPNIRFYAGAQLITPEGYAIGTLCTISDKPKILNDQQRNALEILSREVISQLELRQKIKQLQVAGENKTAFLSDMSHEIRTPLNGIIGTLELLQDSGMNPAQQSLINLALKNSESLLGILNDVLDLSKIEAGKIELDYTEFNLLELMADVASVYAIKAEEKQLDLICPANFIAHSHVRADALRIRQVLNNLLSNAIKFTSEGEVRVSTDIISESEHQLALRFSVADTGIGMTDEQTSELFQRFGQAEQSTCRQYGGTGLGLTISRQLIELMGGNIEVYSQPGTGTTFWFTLTLEKARSPEISIPDSLQDLRVLVMHSHSCYQQLLNELLNHWNIAHQVTSSYDAALEVLDNARLSGRPFNLILADEKTEQKQTVRLIDQITNQTDCTGLRCILLSHPAILQDSHFYQKYDAVIRHPIIPSELLNSLIQVTGVLPPLNTETEKTPGIQFSGKILVVEDNITNQIVTRGILEKYGLTVQVAEHGQQALERVKEQAFDLIFMDCQMPVMDGYQATQHIRQLNQAATSADVPVIALSANAMAAESERCIQVGMNDFLSKPVKRSALESMLQQWLPETESEVTSAVTSDSEPYLPVFNFSSFSERMLADPLLMQAAIEPVLQDLPAQLTSIRLHLNNNDTENLLRVLHQSKGMLANVSADQLTEQLTRLEGAVREKGVEAISPELSRLEQNIALFLSQVQQDLFNN
ncbi:response regulator [Oceanospirillum sediminis]|uniref:histidine kinase n=1 Tax=Oceanospirillum sediminis TaxID=2760088 RepID=A0A839IL10_9GAMM|nr:response regulator [Oceanospirillum sediminis]MBB1485232.1 response regulator [Oceanospirillum sediminis]